MIKRNHTQPALGMEREPAKTAMHEKLRGLYVITDERFGRGHLAIARAAIDGGAAVVQLRDKTTPIPQLLPVAHQIRQMTRAAGIVFLINDRTDIALVTKADGVHLGPDDLPVKDARRLLGADAVIGASCGTAEEAIRAESDGASYIGAGAIFGTATKSDAGAAIGLEALRAIVAATRLPVAAIGGVNARNIASTVEAGASLACVVSAVASAGGEAAMATAARELAALCGGSL